MDQVIGLCATLLVMLVGMIGSAIPVIPGTPLVLLAAIGHWFWFGQHSASPWIMGLLVVITLLSMTLDFLASVFGAKKLGATWRGMTGAVVGAMIGLFFGLPGVLLGPFLGALVAEAIGGQPFELAARAGVGAALGLLVGAMGKVACCLVMIALFASSVVLRSGGGQDEERTLASAGGGFAMVVPAGSAFSSFLSQ